MRRLGACLASAPPVVGHTTNFGGIAGKNNQGTYVRLVICMLSEQCQACYLYVIFLIMVL